MVHIRYLEGVFKSKWLSNFINHWFITGNKTSIEKIIYFNFFLIKKKLKSCPLFYFFEILEKIKPILGLKVFKNKNNKIKKIKAFPYLLNTFFQYKKSIYWLAKSVKIRKEKALFLKINNEFYEILFNNTGNCLKKKRDYYKNIVLFKTIKKFKW